MLPDSYLEILGSEEPSAPPGVDTTTDKEDGIAQLFLYKHRTLIRAMKAATDGDTEEASYLFRLHSTMVIPRLMKKTSLTQTVVIPAPQSDLANKELELDDEKPFVQNGITFMPGRQNLVLNLI